MDASENRRMLLVAGITLLIAAALRLLAYTVWDIHHADEFTQYLEQGHRLADGYGLIPWEARYGIRNALVPQLLAGPMALGRIFDPSGLLGIQFARATFLLLCSAGLWGAWRIGSAQSQRHALLALFVAAIWYDAVLFNVLLLSESAATAIITCGTALLLTAGESRRRLWLAGFLLVLGVLVRLQYAPFVAVLVLVSVRLNWRVWLHLGVGAGAALLLGMVSDLVDGRMPFLWIINNFTMNIESGRAARFGVTGPLDYVRLLLLQYGPLGPAIMAAAVLSGPRYRPVLAAVVVNIVFHSLIGHKEYRFIWLSTFLILVLAAIASVNLADWLKARRRPDQAGGQQAGLSALLLLCLGWLTASALGEQFSGGARTFKGGGVIPQVLHSVAGHPEVCGVAVPEQWRNHTVTAFLGRDIPLYVAPNAVLEGQQALPPALASAANAVLADRALRGAQAYRAIECRSKGALKACLFIRSGRCDKAAGQPYDYQTLLLHYDL